MNDDYDVLVIGGGLVGASLACALTGQGLRIGLVEATPFTAPGQPSYDDRSLALAYGTSRIFAALGLWPAIAAGATPIRKIHISERGGAGFARLDCREEGVEALGYIVEARALGAALGDRLRGLGDVAMRCPAQLELVSQRRNRIVARADLAGRGLQLTARLLVAADGAQSLVRRQLGIDAVRWDYDQTAVIANLTPQHHHENTAYERFTESGPVALLPMSEGRCAAVCTVDTAARDRVLGMDDDAFRAHLQARFGDRLGRLERVGKRQAYPLFMLHSREHMRPRVALIGNAAHTLHPVAGQGFNLGMRDVATLAEVISDAHRTGLDFGAQAVLARYADWRRWDQRRTISFTDGLTRLFGNPLLPLRHARNLGLLAFDLFPPAKRLLARQAMGLDGHLPRLARGLPLLSGTAP